MGGWIRAVRSSGKIRFVQFRDGTGDCQCTVEASEEEAFDALGHCGVESSVRITGVVREEPRSPIGVEVSVSTVDVIQSVADYPIARKEHGIEFLMQHRHLWLRSPRPQAIARVRHRIVQASRNFFDEQGFTLVDTPIFQPGAAEGAGTLFEADYFGNPAYLAQTGQLYLEPAALALGKVYCFGPTFRAEKSKTRRHLTEFWMIEPEVAFYELEDLEVLAEDMLAYIVGEVLKHNRSDLEALGRDCSKLESIQTPFPRITYSEAVDLLHNPALHEKLEKELEAATKKQAEREDSLRQLEQQVEQVQKAWKKEKLAREIQTLREEIHEQAIWLKNQPGHIEDAKTFEWGRDFGGDEETILANQFDRPVIVTRYPCEVKAFYMKRDEDDNRVVRNLDVLAPEGYGEIIGGSQREDQLDLLLERMQAEGMDTGPYEWYLDMRRYGSVPHGGFGLGLERTVAWLCGLKHIRETIAFPRLMGKMHP